MTGSVVGEGQVEVRQRGCTAGMRACMATGFLLSWLEQVKQRPRGQVSWGMGFEESSCSVHIPASAEPCGHAFQGVSRLDLENGLVSAYVPTNMFETILIKKKKNISPAMLPTPLYARQHQNPDPPQRNAEMMKNMSKIERPAPTHQ